MQRLPRPVITKLSYTLLNYTENYIPALQHPWKCFHTPLCKNQALLWQDPALTASTEAKSSNICSLTTGYAAARTKTVEMKSRVTPTFIIMWTSWVVANSFFQGQVKVMITKSERISCSFYNAAAHRVQSSYLGSFLRSQTPTIPH